MWTSFTLKALRIEWKEHEYQRKSFNRLEMTLGETKVKAKYRFEFVA